MNAAAATAPGSLARYARDLAGTDPAAVAAAAGRLAAAVTGDGRPAAEALPLAAALAGTLGQAGERGRARIALLLGILAEQDPGAREIARECLGTCLQLLAAAPCGSAEQLALLYLLAHYPQDRARIMAAAGQLEAADPCGISRLDRSLRTPDPGDPDTVDAAGRCWPSPALLAVTAEETAATAAARRVQPAAQVLASWHADTAALLAYAGARALAGGA